MGIFRVAGLLGLKLPGKALTLPARYLNGLTENQFTQFTSIDARKPACVGLFIHFNSFAFSNYCIFGNNAFKISHKSGSCQKIILTMQKWDNVTGVARTNFGGYRWGFYRKISQINDLQWFVGVEYQFLSQCNYSSIRRWRYASNVNLRFWAALLSITVAYRLKCSKRGNFQEEAFDKDSGILFRKIYIFIKKTE